MLTSFVKPQVLEVRQIILVIDDVRCQTIIIKELKTWTLADMP